ncbi:MAG: GNAT family N-acetyltransferase [Mycobacteriales bacterium]
MDFLQFRCARVTDAETLARLHADSWRRHYRGAYSDAFLDGDVTADRLAVWSERLQKAADGACTIVAETEGVITGFAHTVLDESPAWGALLDNLHVAAGHQRQGIGARLMGRSAKFVVDRLPGSGLHLWVLEQNVAAQRFYEILGGRRVESGEVNSVGGVSGRVNGSPVKLRYAWSDPAVLVRFIEGPAGRA